MSKTKIVLNKLIYLGFCILDISKTYLYDFHCNHNSKKFGKKVKLLYTNTDSLIYHFFVEDIYQEMKKDIHLFNTSNYSPNNVYNIPCINRKILGEMKNEKGGIILLEFIGLRSKMNAIRSAENLIKENQRYKKPAIKSITFEDFYQCLFNHIEKKTEPNLIESRKHEVYTFKQTKVVFNPFDDKRIIINISTGTILWGYH